VGLALNAVYSDGSTGPIAKGWTLTWSGAALAEGSKAISAGIGPKTITVAYGGQTADFTIYVNTNPPTPGDTTPPAKVTGLSADPGNGTVTLSWTDPADADLNYIEITWTGGSVTAEKSTAANRANSKAVTGLTNGTAYTFTVKSVDTSINKSQGETASATPSDGTNPPPDTTPPAEVSGLNGTPGDRTVTLSWTDPTDADLDHIEITWTGGSATAEKSAADDQANSKAITGLTNGTAYTFTVKTVDSSGNKSQGETASATPAPVTTIASTEDWTNALAQISADSNGTGSSPRNYILDIQGIIPVPGTGSDGDSISGNYKTLRLTGSGRLYLSSSGSILRINNNTQTLIIDGPTLNGRSYGADNDVALVHVGDGTVELRNGTISGNAFYTTSESVGGGGVFISGGTFAMSGGTISDNTLSSSSSRSSYGGGVHVSGGTFAMSGGTISSNSISSSGSNDRGGGGVYVYTGGTFTMAGGTISNNSASASSFGSSYGSSYGSGVYINGGTFTMSGGTISNNRASANSYGRGVYVRKGTFTMSGGAISDNTYLIYNVLSYDSYGGGVYIDSEGTFTMAGGTISGNSSSTSTTENSAPFFSYGGGVYVDGTFIMLEGTISGHSASFTASARSSSVSAYGGGVYIGHGTFTMSGGIIRDNTVSAASSSVGATISSGGGVYVYNDGTFIMQEGTISGNFNTGVYVNGAFTMSGGTISSNTNRGVYVGDGTFTMQEGIISGNTTYAGAGGGGVYVGNGTFTMSGGTVSNNTHSGLYIDSNGTFTMQDGTISGNTAATDSYYGGGGVYNSGTFLMQNGTISGNATSYSSYDNYSYYGGGGVNNRGIFTMQNGTISGNTASSNGGGVCNSRSFIMQGGTISGNTARSGGGVYADGGFVKTGGTLYGDTDDVFGNGNATDNTATVTTNPGTNGHAALYNNYSYGYFYRNETLADNASGNISTGATLPAYSSETLNNWTKR
jgi:hypothetical protein